MTTEAERRIKLGPYTTKIHQEELIELLDLWEYPPGVKEMLAEIIREQVLSATSEEVPYATTVMIDQFEEGKKLTRIAATIHCERDGQKRILVGRHAQMLKKIGTQARLQIEKMVGTRVYLELFVKVSPGWRESHAFIEELDWRRQQG